MATAKRITAYKLETATAMLAMLLDCEDLDLSDRDLIQTTYNRLIEYRRSMPSGERQFSSDDRHYRP